MVFTFNDVPPVVVFQWWSPGLRLGPKTDPPPLTERRRTVEAQGGVAVVDQLESRRTAPS